MLVMILGDIHGNHQAARRAVDYAARNGVRHIIWAGDCGLWPGFSGIDFLDEVNFYSRRNNVLNYWVGGNHEWWDEWIRVLRHTEKDSKGFAYLRSHIRLAPRIHTWKWDGRRFMSAAGAVSIDKSWRTPGESWWPQEQLMDAEVEAAARMPVCDYLITHDCSNYTPFIGSMIPSLDSMMHRQKIDKIIMGVRPKKHFHGHMHTQYQWVNEISGVGTETYGLECDGMRWNYGILDTTTNTFTWVNAFDFWNGVK